MPLQNRRSHDVRIVSGSARGAIGNKISRDIRAGAQTLHACRVIIFTARKTFPHAPLLQTVHACRVIIFTARKHSRMLRDCKPPAPARFTAPLSSRLEKLSVHSVFTSPLRFPHFRPCRFRKNFSRKNPAAARLSRISSMPKFPSSNLSAKKHAGILPARAPAREPAFFAPKSAFLPSNKVIPQYTRRFSVHIFATILYQNFTKMLKNVKIENPCGKLIFTDLGAKSRVLILIFVTKIRYLSKKVLTCIYGQISVLFTS